jgi:predicted DNA-binding transcriptional regulator AlpA
MDFLDIKACCCLVGGTRSVHPSTIYRLINRRLWPKPVRVTPGSSRWLRSEVEAALARMVEDRNPA